MCNQIPKSIDKVHMDFGQFFMTYVKIEIDIKNMNLNFKFNKLKLDAQHVYSLLNIDLGFGWIDFFIHYHSIGRAWVHQVILINEYKGKLQV
ncbi:hypothetical protein ACJX0J_029798, partial [Zea mays]